MARRKNLYQLSAGWFRWIHIYVSMLSFAALMFFAFTGITLNHPTWLGAAQQHLQEYEGEIDAELMQATPLRQLEIAETLRANHGLRGRVSEFRVDEYEWMVVFKGPGYAADVFIDAESGAYSVTETTTGAMAVLNDLHKGRDAGAGWSWFIDISAAVMMVMSMSGFGLLLYLKKRRMRGVVTAVVGTLLMIIVWLAVVP